MATTTKLFLSNRSQAVRLAKEVAFPENVREVKIIRDGAKRIIVPTNLSWDDFFEAPGIDIGHREQPQPQKREEF